MIGFIAVGFIVGVISTLVWERRGVTLVGRTASGAPITVIARGDTPESLARLRAIVDGTERAERNHRADEVDRLIEEYNLSTTSNDLMTSLASAVREYSKELRR